MLSLGCAYLDLPFVCQISAEIHQQKPTKRQDFFISRRSMYTKRQTEESHTNQSLAGEVWTPLKSLEVSPLCSSLDLSCTILIAYIPWAPPNLHLVFRWPKPIFFSWFWGLMVYHYIIHIIVCVFKKTQRFVHVCFRGRYGRTFFSAWHLIRKRISGAEALEVEN